MKLRLLFLIGAFLTLSFSTAFAADANKTNNDKNQAQSQEQKKEAADILGWVAVVDKNEIAAAGLALQRKLNSKVEQYATFLKKQHTANLAEIVKVSKKINVTPAKSSASKDLQKEGDEMAADLKKLDDQKFQKKYIEAMIDNHEDVLKKLDDYIDDVKNTELKTFLEKTRAHVKIHLEKAKKIQEELKSNA